MSPTPCPLAASIACPALCASMISRVAARTRGAFAPDAEVRLFAALVSTRQRESTCRQTLANLADTDWARRPMHVQFDERRFSNSEDNLTHAAWLALQAGLQTRAHYLLLLADHLEFNRYFLHNLHAWPLLWRHQIGCASLFNPGLRELARIPLSRAVAVDSRAGLGSPAVLLSRPIAQLLLGHWFEESPRLELKLGTLAARLVGPVFCHWPRSEERRVG